MKQSVLRVEHLSKSYGKRMVIRDISMVARQGESVGLLGPNGAGKTTAFYCITGQLNATGGQIFFEQPGYNPPAVLSTVTPAHRLFAPGKQRVPRFNG